MHIIKDDLKKEINNFFNINFDDFVFKNNKKTYSLFLDENLYKVTFVFENFNLEFRMIEDKIKEIYLFDNVICKCVKMIEITLKKNNATLVEVFQDCDGSIIYNNVHLQGKDSIKFSTEFKVFLELVE